MAYNGSDKYEGLQNSQKQLKPEQRGWKTTADVANKMAEMSLSATTADSGQTSLHEASSAVEHDEETSIKSAVLMTELLNAPPLSREISFDYGVNDSDSRLGQPACSMGVWPRQAGSSLSYFPNGEMQQDVSLKSRPKFGCMANSPRDGLASQNPNHRDSSFGNTALPRGAEIPGHQNPLVLNIPPSMQEQRVKNTDIPTANAEQQLSYRTVSTVNSDLSPISRCVETQYGVHPSQVLNSKPLSSATSSQLTTFTLGAHCISSEDNFHMSFPANVGFHGMMGQAGERQLPPYYNYMGNSAAGCGRQMSHSSSTSSLRSFISDNCLVKKLSWKILYHVALTLQCKNSSASWKDLVERYGWDYERTYLFENRPHTEGIFFSLLLEPEFQDYSLEQLRADLFDLPRRDVLSDLNRMIFEHNASASGGTARQNQFP